MTILHDSTEECSDDKDLRTFRQTAAILIEGTDEVCGKCGSACTSALNFCTKCDADSPWQPLLQEGQTFYWNKETNETTCLGASKPRPKLSSAWVGGVEPRRRYGDFANTNYAETLYGRPFADRLPAPPAAAPPCEILEELLALGAPAPSAEDLASVLGALAGFSRVEKSARGSPFSTFGQALAPHDPARVAAAWRRVRPDSLAHVEFAAASLSPSSVARRKREEMEREREKKIQQAWG